MFYANCKNWAKERGKLLLSFGVTSKAFVKRKSVEFQRKKGKTVYFCFQI